VIGQIKSDASELEVVPDQALGYQLVLDGQVIAVAQAGLDADELASRWHATIQALNFLQESGD
jgi:hypothetical protein